MDTPNRPTLVRDALAALTPIRIKKLFGSEAFFHGERMFAVLDGSTGAPASRAAPDRSALRRHRPAFPLRALGPEPGLGRDSYAEELARLSQLAKAARGGGARAGAGQAAVPTGGPEGGELSGANGYPL